MKIVFISNYYNHHQSELSKAFNELTDGNYYFIQTMPMEEERKALGWGNDDTPPFVYKSYENNENYKKCLEFINEADVVIAGSAPEKMLKQRKKSEKLIFRYSERIYKNRKTIFQLPLRAIKYHLSNQSPNIYLLCASAFAARDYALTGNFINKAYKWGYFPQKKRYDDILSLIDSKEDKSIVWVARFIDWKHPEKPLHIAKRLKENGYRFKLRLIGMGTLKKDMELLSQKLGVEDMVEFLGSMPPDSVREHMEKSQIFLFTSDQNEGWGAVLNEAMNSGCAVVASHLIGSVSFLIKNEENGLIFKNNDIDDLYDKVKLLLDNKEISKKYGLKAYQTIIDNWNAEVASEHFIRLSKMLMSNPESDIYLEGPCSKAELLKNDWM